MFLPTVFITCCLMCGWFDDARGHLTTLSTDRFPPSEGNLLSSPPTLKSLANHANIGSKGAFRFKTGDFHKAARGGKRVRLVQTYSGYDVFGSTVVASANDDNVFTGETYGEIAKSLQREIRFPEACKRNIKIFQNIAIRLQQLQPSDPNIRNRDGRRIIFARPKKRARIAYKVEFLYSNNDSVKWPVYIMDACTGLVLLSYNNIHNNTIPYKRDVEDQLNMAGAELKNQTANLGALPRIGGICSPYINGKGGNEKTGKRTYNLEPLCLRMQKSGSTCTMQGTYVKVVDNFESTTYNKQTVVSFPCLIGYQDGINGAHGVANDAFFYGEESGRFLKEKYNLEVFPYTPRMVVHYGSGFDNAFWDGTDMYFGDGKFYFYPLVSLDVIAHELAHGITTRNSDLVYARQSGGINEAFSDITGEATKHFVFNSNDWEVGATIIKGNSALRYFEDPTRDGRSIKYAWSYRPLMDVHFSSGVFNHAFYHMVAKERMNIFDAYKCFLDANLNLWGPLTNYWVGACNVVQAAFDNGFNHRKVRRSFLRVGLPLFFCKFWRFKAALRAGEERNDVLVRESRSPIFQIETTNESRAILSLVRATTEDGSPVQISVVKDMETEDIIAVGENEVSFDASQGEVFIQLSSNSTNDVKTKVLVS